MSTAADHAFALAYQWWLMCDAYYAETLKAKPRSLDGGLVREIGQSYQVNRTIGDGHQASFATLVVHSGQGNGMDMEERAARISLALKRCDTTIFPFLPISAMTKVSWFIWPSNWTMYDRYAVKVVLGSPQDIGIERLERFYAALAMRGWIDHLDYVRSALKGSMFNPLLAERVIDKYLFLEGSHVQKDDATTRAIKGFVNALPAELKDEVEHIGASISPLLAEGKLLHRSTTTDRQELKARVERLRSFKNGLE